MTGPNSHLWPIVSAVRRFRKLTGTDLHAEGATAGPPANAILERVSRAEAPMAARFGSPLGVLLLAVASR